MRPAWFGILSVTLLLAGVLPQRLPAAILMAPTDFSGVRAYPNPWRSDRHSVYPITFDHLPTDAVTTVRIFTISGQLVKSMSGTQSVQWFLDNSSGEHVASGIYLYLLTANNQQKTGKVVVIR